MAITTLNSASSLFEGTDSAEIVRIDSGGATNSTVKAAGGNDSIFLLSAQANATALYVDANAGADEITLSGDTVDESTIIGGAGGDTITDYAGDSLLFTGLGTLTDFIDAGAGIEIGNTGEFVAFNGAGAVATFTYADGVLSFDADGATVGGVDAVTVATFSEVGGATPTITAADITLA